MCGCGNRSRLYTADDPLILGTDEGDSQQVRATVNVLGIGQGTTSWVRGSKVGFYVDHGYLQPV